MGCGQSKIESEESVTRCKDRKEFMKKALSSRNAFAAAHSAYSVSLRNTGAALADYAHSEAHLFANPPSSSSSAQNPQPSSSSSSSVPSSSSSNPAAAATIVQPPVDAPLPPPPPPLPDFARLQRAASMPEFAIPNKKHAAASKAPADDVIQEEDGDADDEDEGAGDEPRRRRSSTSNNDEARPPPVATVQQQPPPPPPAAEKASAAPVWLSDYFFNTDHMPGPSLSQPEHDETQQIPKAKEKVVIEQPPEPTPPPEPEVKVAPPAPKPARKQRVQQQAAVTVGGEGKRGRGVGNSVNVKKVFDDIDDHFLKASESAHEVSKMLEATRMHYHSNFADNRGHIDHSARVMRAITWNRSCKGMKDENDGKDDFDNEELETHATILDKMLAWEKKLYDEVKAGELMKIEYQRKVALLNKQKKRGSSPETLEKTKAAVSHLHTRYIVDMQSMDSTVSEINRLRDKQLYPKLVALVDGMATMWEKMFMHHSSQLKIALVLRNLDISLSPKETSEQHHETTRQLYSILREWHAQFQGLMKHQREYIQALNSWLKLNLIPIESNLRERVSSPPRVIRPQIQPLLQAWNDLLEKLPDDRPRGIIHTFAEVVHTIIIIQDDELKLKEKCDETRREYIRRDRAFDDWYRKYSEKKAAAAAASAAEAAAAATATEDDVSAATAADLNQDDEVVAERKAVVESLMIRLRNEEESYRRTCKQVREKSVGSLKSHLPELFRALSEFALECSDMYKKLRAITTEPQDEVEGN